MQKFSWTWRPELSYIILLIILLTILLIILLTMVFVIIRMSFIVFCTSYRSSCLLSFCLSLFLTSFFLLCTVSFLSMACCKGRPYVLPFLCCVFLLCREGGKSGTQYSAKAALVNKDGKQTYILVRGGLLFCRDRRCGVSCCTSWHLGRRGESPFTTGMAKSAARQREALHSGPCGANYFC